MYLDVVLVEDGALSTNHLLAHALADEIGDILANEMSQEDQQMVQDRTDLLVSAVLYLQSPGEQERSWLVRDFQIVYPSPDRDGLSWALVEYQEGKSTRLV